MNPEALQTFAIISMVIVSVLFIGFMVYGLITFAGVVKRGIWESKEKIPYRRIKEPVLVETPETPDTDHKRFKPNKAI